MRNPSNLEIKALPKVRNPRNKLVDALFVKIEDAPKTPIEIALHNKIFPADLPDVKYHDIMKEYTDSAHFQDMLIAKIKILMPHISSVNIRDFEEYYRSIQEDSSRAKKSLSLNSSSHKILVIDGKLYHFKPAIQSAEFQKGTKYNELLYYKMCEHLGIGPRCEGITMEDSGALFIFSEDLSTRNLKEKDKEISFVIKKLDQDKFAELPRREQDNIHRIALNLGVFLMDLDDLKNNSGNTGIKIANEKEKVFLVDFTLNRGFGIFECDHQNEFFEFISRVLSGEDIVSIPQGETHLKNFFIPCELTRDSLKTAIQKLCVDNEGNPTKLLNALDESAKYTLDLLEKTSYQTREGLTLEQDKQIHREALEKRITRQRKIIEDFLQFPAIKECIDEKVQEIKSLKSTKLKRPLENPSDDKTLPPTRFVQPAKILRITELSKEGDGGTLSNSPSPSSSIRSGEATISDSPISRTDSPLFSPR